MSSRVRSLVTLGALAAVLAVAAVWGWSAIREPFPKEKQPPICREREVAQGDTLAPRDITVSVWNAGDRVGLAGLTMDLLSEAGFHEGNEGNTPGKRTVDQVEIWTEEPQSPAVRLVASYFREPEVVRRPAGAAGVLVVVGDGFDDLTAGREKLTVRQPATVCGPPRRAR